MKFTKLIKENFVLSLGIALPVLIMVVFFIATSFNNPLSPSTNYNFILSDDITVNAGNPVSAYIFVKNNMLYVQYSQKDPKQYPYITFPRLYLYEVSTSKLRQLDFPPLDTSDPNVFGKQIPIDSTKLMKIDSSPTSPDGFQFTYVADDYDRGGLINDLFWGGGYNNDYGPRLKKGNSSLRLPIDSLRYGQYNFVGWVIGNQP